MTASTVTIRPLKTLEDCRHFQELQRRIWESEPDDIVPIHVLITQAKNGGLLLGAFTQKGPTETGGMVGMAFGWPGFITDNDTDSDGAKRLKHCSHMVGVLPAWHGRGIGLQLKLAQREHILAEGMTDWVTWTYDPLQRVNGRFNIHRLGATCTTYLRNVYGEMTDSLNAGMPSDRFLVDWRLRSPRVRYALAPDRKKPDWASLSLTLARTRPLNEHPSLRAPVEPAPPPDGRPYALPLPDSVNALRTAGAGLLHDWRYFVRRAAEACFSAGYVLVDCVMLSGEWRYLLAPEGMRPFGDLPWP